ncbi:MAG: NAD kinase [Rhodobacter sp.]|nr:NAD kinase [Rhodobacter sp.]
MRNALSDCGPPAHLRNLCQTARRREGIIVAHRQAKRGPIVFPASQTEVAQWPARTRSIYGDAPLQQAGVIVALGGDGFMLRPLHATQHRDVPVHGMNGGAMGFRMNSFATEDLPAKAGRGAGNRAEPAGSKATDAPYCIHEALAINEVSLLREGPQAVRLRITVDGLVRMEELVCDGALLATPAGSTAYNYSAHGPILPIGADVLALTAMAAFRPRRWRGALLPKSAVVRFDVLDPEKRPVMADADAQPVRNVVSVEIRSEPRVKHRLLFDPGHGLEERLIREQFF